MFWFADKKFERKVSKVKKFLSKNFPDYAEKFDAQLHTFEANLEKRIQSKFPDLEDEFKMFLKKKLGGYARTAEAGEREDELAAIESKIDDL